MGEDPSRADAAKIVANMMITMATGAIGEAVALTESNRLFRGALLDLDLDTLFDCRAHDGYSANIAKEAYAPDFKAKLGLNDLRSATQAPKLAGRRPPMLEAVRERMGEAVDAGPRDKDWSIMADFQASPSRASTGTWTTQEVCRG